MKFGICLHPFLPVYATASWGELSNQLLFGDTFEVVTEKAGTFCKIRTSHDSYEGWIDSSQVYELSEDDYRSVCSAPNTYTLDAVSTVVSQGIEIPVVRASRLPNFQSGRFHVCGRDFVHTGRVTESPCGQLKGDDFVSFGKLYLGVPYLWGGRTPFGIDCSGLTQMVCRLAGINLKRDCAQQIEQGTKVGFAEARIGDLVFCRALEFDSRHVGIALGDNLILHSFSVVRVDRLDERGITPAGSGALSHELVEVRRLVV